MRGKKGEAKMKNRRTIVILVAVVATVALMLIQTMGLDVSSSTPTIQANLGPWVKYPGNPVFDAGPAGSWESNLSSACVIRDGDTYKMWYSGWDGSASRIGYATSNDGINWIRYPGNPVLDLGPPDSWDEARVDHPAVVLVNGTYRMWYRGGNTAGARAVGYATSPDGITWMKYDGNPVLTTGPSGSWDDGGGWHSTVLYKGGIYSIWYYAWATAGGGRIGYASSSDGINWNKYEDNPVLTPGDSSSWEYPYVFQPKVIFDPGSNVYRMWYAAYNETFPDQRNRFGYATSLDGLHWTKYVDNPVLRPGAEGDWDYWDIHYPHVIQEGNTYKMWYVGGDANQIFCIGQAIAQAVHQAFLPMIMKNYSL